MMKTFPRQSSRGIALIIVMICIATLSAMAAVFALHMKVETKLAQNAEDEPQLLWLGRSGVELARWVLSQEASIAGQRYDALNQIWAGGSGSLTESNSVLVGIPLDNYPIGEGSVSIKIIDLDRKMNINTATPAILQQALTLMGVDADDVSVISDSILDWIDTNDDPRIAGAESDYYQSLTPPYYAKNAPIDDLSELLLVKGIAEQPEIYWGGAATNLNRPQTHLGFGHATGEIPSYPFGLKDLFTATSSGRLNVNTADVNALQMIPGVDTNTAALIVSTRAGPDGVEGNDDDTPFQSVNDLARAGINPQVTAQLGNVCTVRSSVFEVHVTARIGNSQREYIALLYRNSGTDIPIVSFYWK